MTKARPLVLVIGLATIAACTRHIYPPPAAPREPSSVSASFGRTWDAAVEVLADGNAPITQLHRESGYLNTDVVRATNTKSDTLAECWRVRIAGQDSLVGPTNAYYNVVVRGDSSRSSVKVNARWVNIAYTGNGPVTVSCESRGIWESATEDAIRERAERRR